jgi:hypothetical protein
MERVLGCDVSLFHAPTSDQLLLQLLDGLQLERSEGTWLLLAKHPLISRTGRILPKLKRPREPRL